MHDLETVFSEIDILTLLPQQRPFVLIDSMLTTDETITATSFLVGDDCIFCENGRLTESGIIENIAQTCAARMGYINKFLAHDSVKLGFIGAIRNLEIRRLPLAGQRIETKIEVLEEIFKMTLVAATVTHNSEIIASGEMKISLTDIDTQADGKE